MTSELFLDASYAIALSSVKDAHHRQAIEISQRLESEKAQLITTRAVVLEIGNALARLQYRRAAVALLEAIENDSRIEIVPASESRYQRAFELFRAREDKEWGLTDCLSFVVMHERGLTEALTADLHFRQAGYRALLLEDD